jgi:asparagine synthase (glutamine-hydrolysing)
LAGPSAGSAGTAFLGAWPDPGVVLASAEGAGATVDALAAAPPLGSLAETMMYADLVSYLPDDVLTKVDRASMSVGFEVRAPFLDHRVVEWAWAQPLRLKVRGGQGKWLLRRVLDRYVPRRLVDRPKAGFDVPVGAWLRGPLRGWAEDLHDPGRLRRQGLLRPEPVSQRWQAHLAGRGNGHDQLWTLLMLQAWLRHVEGR